MRMFVLPSDRKNQTQPRNDVTGMSCDRWPGFCDSALLCFAGINPLGIPDQLGQAQDLLGHPPGVVLGQALGEVPARRLVVEIDVGEDAASGVPDLERLALLLDLPRLGKGSGVLGDQASSAGSTGSSFHSATASLFVAAQILAPQCKSQLMYQLPPYLWSRGLGKPHRGHGNNLGCIDHREIIA